jgi:hypothetical protein
MQGTISLIDAAKAAGVKAFVLQTSLLTNAVAVGQKNNSNYKFLNFFGGVLDRKLVRVVTLVQTWAHTLVGGVVWQVRVAGNTHMHYVCEVWVLNQRGPTVRSRGAIPWARLLTPPPPPNPPPGQAL